MPPKAPRFADLESPTSTVSSGREPVLRPLGVALGAFIAVSLLLPPLWIVSLSAADLPITLSGVVRLHDESPALALFLLLPTGAGLAAVPCLRLYDRVREQERRIAEQEVELRQLRVADVVVRNALDAVIVVNPLGLIERVNPTAERMFGYAEAELRGCVIEHLIPDHGDQSAEKSVRRRTSKNVVLGTEWHMKGRHKDGTTFPIELTYYQAHVGEEVRFVYVIGDPQGAAGALRRSNGLLREARARALEELRTKDQFLARVAYDLRTPLAGVLGYAEQLIDDADDLKLQHILPDLHRIRAGGRQVMAVIANVLEVSADDQRARVLLERLDVAELVQDVSLAVRKRFHKKRTNLDVALADDAGKCHADGLLLRRVLLKLLDNAGRFTDGGQVVLETRRDTSRGRARVIFEVRDNGCGMNEAQLRAAFDPKRKSEVRFSKQGLDLTLAQARHLAEAMDGELLLHSEPGRGTTATLVLHEAPIPGRESGGGPRSLS